MRLSQDQRLIVALGRRLNDEAMILLNAADLVLRSLPVGDPLRLEVEEMAESGLRLSQIAMGLLGYGKFQHESILRGMEIQF